MSEITPLFSIPLYTSSMEISNDVKNFARGLEFFRVESNNGYRSVNTKVLAAKELEGIRSVAMDHVERLSRTLCIAPNVRFKITNSWVMKHVRGDWAHEHCHTNSLLSALVYLDTDGTTGDINFNSRTSIFPSAVDVEFYEYNIYNSKGWTISPKTGDIMIFPSTLLHSVSTNIYNKERYCLAFNLFAEGHIGMKDSSSVCQLSLL